MKKIMLIALTLLGACAADAQQRPTLTQDAAPVPQVDVALVNAVEGAWRTPAQRARDQYRHPQDALTFWGLRPGATIVEIDPGGGSWWTQILAPYAHATNGRYVAGYVDLGSPTVSEGARNARAAFLQEYSNTERYGRVEAVNFGNTSGLALPDNSADFILVARAFHNWARVEGRTDRYMAEFARVLKPGGVLAVEQHRAPAGSDVATSAPTGYVPESYVIEAAARAGLTLAARSEINANPRDDHNHPFGVWTLPPVRQSAPSGQPANAAFDHTEFDAIGESDRMTLRFVKP
jgi:predicted methyltransferase